MITLYVLPFYFKKLSICHLFLTHCMCDLSDIPFVRYSLTVHQFFLSMILGISFFLEWAWLCCKIVIAIINSFFLKFTEIKIDIKIIYNSYMTFDKSNTCTYSFLPSLSNDFATSLSFSICTAIFFWYCFNLSLCCFSCY